MNNSFFYSVFIDPFTDGFLGAVLGVLMWIFGLVIVGFIVWGSLFLIDSVGVKEKQGNGVVIAKWFEPAHTYTTIITVGKTTVPQVHYVPESWKAKIQINDIADNVSFCESNWDQLEINQTVSCTYKNGRIWHSLYISNVSW